MYSYKHQIIKVMLCNRIKLNDFIILGVAICVRISGSCRVDL